MVEIVVGYLGWMFGFVVGVGKNLDGFFKIILGFFWGKHLSFLCWVFWDFLIGIYLWGIFAVFENFFEGFCSDCWCYLWWNLVFFLNYLRVFWILLSCIWINHFIGSYYCYLWFYFWTLFLTQMTYFFSVNKDSTTIILNFIIFTHFYLYLLHFVKSFYRIEIFLRDWLNCFFDFFCWHLNEKEREHDVALTIYFSKGLYLWVLWNERYDFNKVYYICLGFI